MAAQLRRAPSPVALTAAAAALILALGPAPGDAAVHLYRTFLVRSGALVWDNYWYGGHYPLASYSLLYYLPAALVGNLVLVVAATVASTLLFTSIARQEWGEASVWPARVFGVCAAAPFFTGLYSYTLGFATMLGAVRALQARRPLVAASFAALTLGFSPLAFVFLCALLVAIVIARRQFDLSVGIAVAALVAAQLVLLVLFPSKGVYPFHSINLAAMIGVCTLGFLLARRAERGGVLAAFFLVWGAGSIAISLVPSQVGDNWARLNEVVFPLMLLTATLARFRPRALAAVALAGAFAFNVVPYLMLIPYRLDDRPATESYWQAPLAFLHEHQRPGYRVEVVPTAAHWESYWLPRSGVPIARGWYRQLDIVENPVLYEQRIEPARYRAWLRKTAVEFVLLPHTRLDFVAAAEEARVLRSGRSGLTVAWSDEEWTIYRLPQPTPLLTGPAPATISRFGHTRIAGTVAGPGTYRLRVRYVPFWRTTGPVCVHRAGDGMTALTVARAGSFSLRIASTGQAVLRAAEGAQRCS
jgi:hypothetical protein